MHTFLARYRLAHKLLISSLAFALPLAVLLYYVVSAFNANIRMAESEAAGTRSLAALRQLAESLPVDERLSHFALQGKATADDLGRLRGEIDGALDRLRAAGNVDRELLARIGDEWRAVKAARDLTPEESDTRHQSLRDGTQRLIKRLGDSSSLILDPSLDSYYLMDVALLSMPKVQEDLSDVLFSIQRDLARGSGTQNELMSFNSAASKLDWAAFTHIREKVDFALRENKRSGRLSASLQARMPPLLGAYDAAQSALMEKLGAVNPADPQSVAELNRAGQALWDAGSALWRGSTEELRTLLERRTATQKRNRFVALALSLLAVGLAAGLVLLVTRNATRPMERVAEIAGEIAAGRLRQAEARLADDEVRRLLGVTEIPPEARDEAWRMFQAFRTMTHGLASLLGEVRNSSSQVSGSANHMAAAVRQLEATAAEQASSTSSVAATSNEIFATVKDLATTMDTVTRMAADAAELADSGMRGLGGIDSAMDNLLDATANVSQVLLRIREQSARISEVITAITKIANRTNLLSLNAAIQAEKAGEHAAGFSVVAVEIRRLADQTSVAALDIEESIREMQGAVGMGVEAVEQYATQARASSQTISGITSDLGRLLEYTQKLGPHFADVNNGMQVQSEGAGHITAAMQELNEAARQTRDSLTGFRQVTEQMRAAVAGLEREVARFSKA
jgi:methyl-accepting chemotaxis protein WspA